MKPVVGRYEDLFSRRSHISRGQSPREFWLLRENKEANIDDHISFKDEVWSSDVKNWPKVDLSQIFSFVLSRKEHEIDFAGHYKTQKAYSYYQSGFVDTIYFTLLSGTKVVKSRIWSSMFASFNPVSYSVWSLLSCCCSVNLSGVLDSHDTCNFIRIHLEKIYRIY
jgi:hypothetical protein